ncbi:MAG TPA: hypothetical protein PLJ21_03980 [Pseudobdellovibrionaceae bacterium]|nr:hypothetical protein [Pseudobdellovibrionaceae bacterium]
MKLEQLIQKTQEETLQWREPDLIRIHEQIMSRVVQTRIQKVTRSEKLKNYMSLHWRIWAQSSLLLSGLIALVLLSVDKENLYLKSISQMTNAQARHQEILKSVQNDPELLSENMMINEQDSDFYIGLAYNFDKKKNKEQ